MDDSTDYPNEATMTVGNVNQLSGLGFNGGTGSAAGSVVRTLGMEGVAQLLGVPGKQLQSNLANGQPLVQILQSHGMSLEQGAEAFLNGVQTGLSNAVADGSLTPQQADTILPRANNRLTTLLEVPSQPVGAAAATSGGNGTGRLLDTFA